jgi:hypothetical protein
MSAASHVSDENYVRWSRSASWLAVLVLTAGVTAVSVRQALVRYRELRSGWSWDLAYYNQWFWALTYGDGRLSVSPIASFATEGPQVWKMNYLAPVRLLIAPVYLAAPGPTTLLVVHGIVFWWVIPAAFTLVRSETGSNALALSAAALVPLTPMLWPLAWNDFRELQMALPFVLWSVQGVRARRVGLSAFGIGGMLACRQEFAVVAATLAILPPREPEDVGRTYRWAHALIVVGLGWILFGYFAYLRYVMGRESPLRYIDQFLGPKARLGQSLTTAGEFLVLGLGAWAVFLVRVPRVALLMVPWLWSLAGGRWALRYLATEEWHHVRYAAPFVGLGLAAGLIGFGQVGAWLLRRPRGALWLALVWLAAAAGSGLALADMVRRTDRQPYPISPAEARAVWSWIDRVGPDDGVLAVYDVTAPLSSRRLLYSYVLTVNRPLGYPTLGPEVVWVFWRNNDGGTQVFEEQGFNVVHRGPYLTVLRRPEGGSRPVPK